MNLLVVVEFKTNVNMVVMRCWSEVNRCGKCKFFAWFRTKILTGTVDSLARMGWPHQQNCSLCSGRQKTVLHLRLHCPYAVRVWSRMIEGRYGDKILQKSGPSIFMTLLTGGDMPRKKSHKEGPLMVISSAP